MRFCQTDGTSLVADAPPLDPYKTMVARPEDIAAAMPPAQAEKPIPPPPADEQVLEIPAEKDPNKTMYASEDEIRREMDSHDRKDEQLIDIPPLVETPAPEPPRFSEPELNPPSFGASAPPSPFSTPKSGEPSPFEQTSPIPSPFGEQKPSSFDPAFEKRSPFAEPEPMDNMPSANPFDPPMGVPGGQMAQAEWTPPPIPDSSWQNQQIGQNTPFQPPPAGSDGENKTLAIVSLVLGILSIVCCGFLTGVPAIVVGYIAKNKVAENPREFGGSGLATGGIITGAIGTVLGILFLLLQIFLGGLGALIQ